MKNLQTKLKEIFEPGKEEFWTGKEETVGTDGFEVKVFEDGRGSYFILDTVTSGVLRTRNYETAIEFVSERLGGWSSLND